MLYLAVVKIQKHSSISWGLMICSEYNCVLKPVLSGQTWEMVSWPPTTTKWLALDKIGWSQIVSFKKINEEQHNSNFIV